MNGQRWYVWVNRQIVTFHSYDGMIMGADKQQSSRSWVIKPETLLEWASISQALRNRIYLPGDTWANWLSQTLTTGFTQSQVRFKVWVCSWLVQQSPLLTLTPGIDQASSILRDWARLDQDSPLLILSAYCWFGLTDWPFFQGTIKIEDMAYLIKCDSQSVSQLH